MLNEKPALLEIRNITKRFGGLTALDNVSFKVKAGSLKSIIGPNGAGKTTSFNIISSLFYPEEGKIIFYDKDITILPPYIVAKLGITRTFQHPRVCPDMTVLENVLVTSCNAIQGCFLATGFNLPFIGKKAINGKKKAMEKLDFVGLSHRCTDYAKVLTHCDQKLLELARALSFEHEPKLLLLDEPTAGLNDDETISWMDLVKQLKETGLTILLIEHRMDLVLAVSDEIVVLNFGKVLEDNLPEAVCSNEKVIDAYLGSCVKEDVSV